MISLFVSIYSVLYHLRVNAAHKHTLQMTNGKRNWNIDQELKRNRKQRQFSLSQNVRHFKIVVIVDNNNNICMANIRHLHCVPEPIFGLAMWSPSLTTARHTANIIMHKAKTRPNYNNINEIHANETKQWNWSVDLPTPDRMRKKVKARVFGCFFFLWCVHVNAYIV